MAEIFVVDVNEAIGEKCRQQLLNAVSEDKREKIYRFHYEKDALRALYADTLARYLACNKLGIKNKDIIFKYNEYGKPYLQGVPDVYFNVSHSGQYVICGWSQHEIGVDVEEIKKIDLDIAKRFFTAGEYEYIISNITGKQAQYFYEIWTMKESYIKYKGKGLSMPLDSFELIYNNGFVELKSNDEVPPRIYRPDFNNNYKIAVCTEDNYVSEVSAVSLLSVCQILIN